MLDWYSRIFFWVFVAGGAIWGLANQEFIDDYVLPALDKAVERGEQFIKEDVFAPGKAAPVRNLGDAVWALVKIVLILALGILMIVFWAAFILLALFLLMLCGLLYILKLHVVLIGVIFSYPFYVVFLNLFELFLVLLIRHPAVSDIRLLVRSRDIDYDLLKRIANKVDIPIRANPPELAAHVLTRHLRKVWGLVGLELWPVRSLRMAKLHQALESAH